MGSGISCKPSNNNIHPRPEAVTEYGNISGKHYVMKDGRVADVFLGIPYAKPPVGELRFEKPQPPEPWEKMKSTIKYKSRPIQQDYFWDRLQAKTGKSEDCLYLNIMVPNWNPPSTKGFPVIFYIHGGGYSIDSAAKIPFQNICNTMVSNDIVFVTVEYRLGFLGFFTTDDEIATGNYGIWDQYMALLFIKNNIVNFKGDPNNITVMGQSAGAASADLLSLSPFTRDLFDKMILMSGNAETLWSISPRPHVAQNCRKKAIELGFEKLSPGQTWTKDDNLALMAFMKQQKASKLGTTMMFKNDMVEPIQLEVTPIIDGEFFPKSLNELREEAPRKCIIVGETEFEALAFFSIGQVKVNKKLLTFFCERTQTVLQQIDKISDKSKHYLTYEKWEQLYGISNGSVKNKTELKDIVTRINSGIISTIPLYNFIQKSIQQRSTVYAYNFTHFNKQSLSAVNLFMPKIGSTHSCDILHLFDVNYYVVPFTRTEADLKVTKILSTLFTNFAKCGSPNFDETNPFSISHDLTWDPIKLENPINCLTISSTETKMEEVERLKRCIPQSETYSKLHEWLTVMDETVFHVFKENVKYENK